MFKPETLPGTGLTLAVIAKNEEQSIQRCLGSARAIATEMVVVDTGSTDKTQKLAKEAGARVFEEPWRDDFSAARNRSLREATGKWILVLDADEFLPPKSAAAIARLLDQTPSPDRAFHLINKSSSDSGRTGASGLIVRLFPNLPEIRYEWPIHEQVVTSIQRAGLQIVDTAIEIIHTGYTDSSTNAAKQTRNLRILEKFIADNPSPHPMALFLQGGALLDLSRIGEARLAYSRAMSLSKPGDIVHEAARVRLADCLFSQKDFEAIFAMNPPMPRAEWHPDLLVLMGQASVALGETQVGLSFFKEALVSKAKPRIPAYDPVRTAIRAVMGIASLFEKTDPRRAVMLLRLATESAQTGIPVSLSRVADVEAEHTP